MTPQVTLPFLKMILEMSTEQNGRPPLTGNKRLAPKKSAMQNFC